MIRSRAALIRTAFLPCALLALAGCEEAKGDFASFDAVELQVQPENIVFPSVGLGQETRRQITIQNLSQSQALLRVALTEEASASDQELEFSFPSPYADALRGEVVLEGNEAISFEVAYKPSNTASDAGAVTINYNNPDKPAIVIPLSTTDANPDIDGPTRVLFGRVPANAHAQKNVTLQNVGSSPLTLREIVLSTAQEFSVCYPASPSAADCPSAETIGAFPRTLAPLDTFDLRVNYDPADDGEDIATLRVVSDDPDEGSFNINLNGNGSQPCITVDGEGGLDFGTGFIGGVSQRTLNIRNCSPNKELIIDQIALVEGGDAEFFLSALPAPLPEMPTTVPVGETANFVLNYAPLSEATNAVTIEILSNDQAKSPLLIPVTGVGSNNACPVAVATAKETGAQGDGADTLETIPLATLQFDGGASTDPDAPNDPAAISGYEWSIVTRPSGSTSSFVPNNRERNPQLFIDLAGTYVVELRVFDQQNIPSCSTARVVILATPNEDVHIQLVWETPGDPDPTDSGIGKGADLDLHFLHPRGNWNATPWDCYWLNPTNNWAGSGPTDDPSLDIDDTDGAGPENVNLNNPEDLTYQVGVFYFADHNFGPSNATLRIFLEQVLVFEARDEYLERTGKFWHAAAIQWGDNPSVASPNQIYDGFP